MSKKLLFSPFLFILIACQNQPKDNDTDSAIRLYNDASKMVTEMNHDSAIILLRQAFEQGIEQPMKIIADSSFYSLTDNPLYRSEIRNLLKEFAIENHATMVRDEEPGASILVKGIVLDESNNKPIENVLVELVHTDNKGSYFKEKSMWNPRLFSYLKTDSNGEFSVNTILPGRYQDDEGNEAPSHIHFSLEADGYRVYASEFTFENDSIFKDNGNIDNVPVAKLKNDNGKEYFHVTLFLQRE